MTEREYNEHPGVRRSDLWKISESPEKYLWAINHPLEPTPALTFGAATHSYILEPDKFNDEYAVAPTVDKRTKAGKEAWERFCADNAGKTVISEDDFRTMTDMRSALMQNPIAKNLIYGKGMTETPIFWKDADTGEKCKAKLDRLVMLDMRWVVVDYKTAKSAQTDQFVRSMLSYGYHLQCAMYTEAVLDLLKTDYRPDFIFVVQEKTEPYAVNVIRVGADSEVMLYGIDTFRELIGTLHQCKLTDFYPGYTGAFGEMNEAYLPGWVNIADGDE